eukprot:TRINITY_DN327_c1_g4_i1.p1 TRINITY_DN327_c1_g4~~TRINITY_DN327_c1_g4_i1.p1  ORF type:complete len:335 (-),score=93.07 TRINITY_DN327_c1_g4_i1:31-1035(-)
MNPLVRPPNMGSLPPRTGNPLMGDPNYSYWNNHYSWWYHNVYPHGSGVDTKVSRLGYILGAQLVQDKIDAASLEVLRSIKLKVLDFSTDADVPAYLEAIVGKIEIVKPHEIPFHIVNHKLQPNQYTVAINGLHTPQTPEIMQALYIFAMEGGRIYIVNSAAHIVAGLFAGKIRPKAPSTVDSTRLKILAEKELFSGYQNNELINLEYFRYPLEVVDKESVTTITKINAGSGPEPLFIKFEQGNGMVFIMVSKMLTAFNLFKPKAKTIPHSDLIEFLNARGASKTTIAAWEVALKVGYHSAVGVAVSALPSIEMMTKLFIRERAISQVLPDLVQQ